MLSLEIIIAGAILVSLTFYALLGCADFGGGVWDLLAWGPRAKAQRKLIADAIGPIWEANHVWLILVIVIIFTGFPSAFSVISTALHIPLTMLLIGIVLRGTTFTFRHYDTQKDNVQRRWGTIFSITSLISPVILGVIIGAIASGNIRVENGYVTSGFLNAWIGAFPLAVGFFALTLFAFLAAVYLTVEASDTALQEDFRKNGLIAAVVVGVMALIVYLASINGAPMIKRGLSERTWTWPLQIITAILASGAIVTLWQRKYRLARIFAAGQVVMILWGWGAAQFPYLIVPDVTISGAAAAPITLKLLLGALLAGSILLFPSFYYLFYIFKFRQGVINSEEPKAE